MRPPEDQFLTAAGNQAAEFGGRMIKVVVWTIGLAIVAGAAFLAYSLYRPWALEHDQDIRWTLAAIAACYALGLLSDIRNHLAAIARALSQSDRL